MFGLLPMLRGSFLMKDQIGEPGFPATPCDEEKRMNGMAIRWLTLTVSIIVTAYVVDGIQVDGFWSAFLAAAALGILNAFFRPIILILTLPINVLTMGLFTFVINALLLRMASGVITGFHVQGFWSAVFGALLISVVSWLINGFINGHGRVEYIDLKHKGGNRWE